MTTKAEPTPAASLFRKLAAVSGAIVAVEKDGRNKDQGYRYPTPASVMIAVKPLLDAQKLAIVPHLVDYVVEDTGQRSGGGKPFVLNRVTMHYHILDGDSGEEMVVPWQGQSGTYGDDKGLAKAQTIALRTFLIQLFQIPAEDPDTDPDARDARAAQHQQPARHNGASYHPDRDQPRAAPAAPAQPSNRQRMLSRITALTAEAEQLDLEITLAKPLDQMADDELTQHGKNLVQAIAAAQRAAEPTAA